MPTRTVPTRDVTLADEHRLYYHAGAILVLLVHVGSIIFAIAIA